MFIKLKKIRIYTKLTKTVAFNSIMPLLFCAKSRKERINIRCIDIKTYKSYNKPKIT